MCSFYLHIQGAEMMPINNTVKKIDTVLLNINEGLLKCKYKVKHIKIC